MLENLFSIFLFIPALICLGFMLKHDMHMMQQNSYRNERYIKWLKMSGDTSSLTRLVAIALLMMLLAFGNLLSPIASLGYIIMAIVEARRKYKKPVVFTKRVWRLYISCWVLVAAIVAGAAYVNAKYAIYTLMLSIPISYIITIVANWAMKPVENAINKSFVDDAKKRLASMPDMKIVGITGSYGKTSTKHYLNRILCEKYNVLMTPGSFNTPMGVVRTVREYMQPYNDLFIVEMGAKNVGDIKEICDIVHPTIGIVTAVGPQHLESFKTIENVQNTKFELVDALPADGFVAINNDFEYIANRKVENVKTVRYAVSNPYKADYTVSDIDYSVSGTSFAINMPDGNSLHMHTKLVGECNISNLLAAVIVALHLDVPVEKIKYAVSKIEQVEHRLNMKRTASGVTIIDDAFNSNPDGSKMALDVLARMNSGKRIVVTPGMIELGDKQSEFNSIFGERIARSCDVAIIVGEYNRDAILSGFNAACSKLDQPNAPQLITVDSFQSAQVELSKILVSGDTVLYENDLPDTFK